MARSRWDKRRARKFQEGVWIFLLASMFIGTAALVVVASVKGMRQASLNGRAAALRTLPGLGAASPEETARAVDAASRRLCPAGDGYTVAACLAFNRFCLLRRKNLKWVRAAARAPYDPADGEPLREADK